MEFKEALDKLKSSKLFLDWAKENNDHYLSHGFLMKEASKQDKWDFGYVNPKNSTITVFEVKEEINMLAPAEPLKKDEAKIEPLVESKINSTLAEVLEIITKIAKEKYNTASSLKLIILVQTLPIGQCWNVSLVTQSFKILNIKVDTNTKEVLEDKIVSLIQN